MVGPTIYDASTARLVDARVRGGRRFEIFEAHGQADAAYNGRHVLVVDNIAVPIGGDDFVSAQRAAVRIMCTDSRKVA